MEESKNLEQNSDRSGEKLHLSDVSDSTKKGYKAYWVGGFINHTLNLAKKIERYDKFVNFYQLKK